MRTLFLKQHVDPFGPWHPVEYRREDPASILGKFYYKPTLWEMTCCLQADWQIVPGHGQDQLAVAGEGNVVETAEVGRHAFELLGFVNGPGSHEFQGGSQLVQEGVDFHELGLALPGAIDLAINAVEIADFIGVEIHADRNPAGAAAEDRIHEPVSCEQAGMISV